MKLYYSPGARRSHLILSRVKQGFLSNSKKSTLPAIRPKKGRISWRSTRKAMCRP